MSTSTNLSHLRKALLKSRTGNASAQARVQDILANNAEALLLLYEHYCRPPVLTDYLHSGRMWSREILMYLYRTSLLVKQTDVAVAMGCSTSQVSKLVSNNPLTAKLSVIHQYLTATRKVLGDKADLIVSPFEFTENIRDCVMLAVGDISPEELVKYATMPLGLIRTTLTIRSRMSVGRGRILIDAANSYRASQNQVHINQKGEHVDSVGQTDKVKHIPMHRAVPNIMTSDYQSRGIT